MTDANRKQHAYVSLGDAWIEPYASDPGGNYVVIVRSDLFRDILERGVLENELLLNTVEPEIVEQTQAAGFRQRREGLAYRLSYARGKSLPRKRVSAQSKMACHSNDKSYTASGVISVIGATGFFVWLSSRTELPFTRNGREPCSYLYKVLAYEYGDIGALLNYVEHLRKAKS